MKHVVKKLRSESKEGGKVLTTYLVIDDQGNKEEIKSLQDFKDGERVESWFDSKWNSPKMRRKQ